MFFSLLDFFFATFVMLTSVIFQCYDKTLPGIYWVYLFGMQLGFLSVPLHPPSRVRSAHNMVNNPINWKQKLKMELITLLTGNKLETHHKRLHDLVRHYSNPHGQFMCGLAQKTLGFPIFRKHHQLWLFGE